MPSPLKSEKENQELIEKEVKPVPLPPAENPCLACSIGQDCCTNLNGLRLTEQEYLDCFADKKDEGSFTVVRDGPLYVINPSGSAPCPNWVGDGCSIYDHRPFECRLFPHSLYVKKATAKKVEARFHPVHSCPQLHQLRASDHEAKELVSKFCKEGYGEDRDIKVKRESWLERCLRKLKSWNFSRLQK